MLEIRIYDMKLALKNRANEMPLLKKLNDVTMYKDMEFGGFIVIKNQCYRQCMYIQKEDILCVEPTRLEENPEEILYESEFICPYCKDVDDAAFELSDGGEATCGSCGSDLEYERVVTVEYNVRPVKCAPITRI